MVFSRETVHPDLPDADVLTRNMIGIGMNFAGEPNPTAQIEETLLHASILGMDESDLRVLSVLTTWIGVHYQRINAARLLRTLASSRSPRVHAYWASIALWLEKDRRFSRMRKLHENPPVDLLTVGTGFQIQRRGEDKRFVGSQIRVPEGTLRNRLSDVVPAENLVHIHPGYRNRVVMGPTWRADVWTVLEENPNLNVSQIARRAGCSFATAWQVFQDHRLVTSKQSPP